MRCTHRTHGKIFQPFDPSVLRYSNETIYSCRHNAIPTATLETSRWDVIYAEAVLKFGKLNTQA
ncbi:MAG: hypothetical protein LBL62_01395 [Planctomycetaceae bacterium]|nr:hypothetical protein [Planctomycetaceae bacterium]